ncbi:hypothetical protein E2C01_095578 [Portunus trituberculatus]|uniref:Uncharacterized protein n=1 Tax=Portunus trituberculatus TaxID=210409 RepID=A0A5B7JZR7_PORTR|nr:hypothetical protein [Portunus trituberculatus]
MRQRLKALMAVPSSPKREMGHRLRKALTPAPP